MKFNALVVGGGQWQVPIIRFLQTKKYTVFVADPYITSMGVMIADEHIQADVRDFEKIKNLTAGIRIDLVITDQSDIAVETVQKLATHFGLRRNNPNAVKKFTNKFISRQYATEQKIPVPAFCNAFTADEVKSAVTVIGLPVILKPVDSQSSRGIFKIDESNIDQLDQLIPLIFILILKVALTSFHSLKGLTHFPFLFIILVVSQPNQFQVVGYE